MRYDIFGRYQLEIRRQGTRWQVLRPGNGLLVEVDELVIPTEIEEAALIEYLYDLLHEEALPGCSIRCL